MTPAITEHLQNAFQWTWQTSAQASIFVGLILLLLFVCGRHLSPRWRMTLGLLILMRLMIPTLPESSFSYLNLIPTASSPVVNSSNSLPAPLISAAPRKGILTSRIRYSRPVVTSHITTTPVDFISALAANPVIAPVSNSIIFNAKPVVPKAITYPSPLVILTSIWLIGMLSLLISTLYRRYCLFKKIQGQSRLPDNSAPTIILDLCRNKMGLKREIPLIPCKQIQTAAVLGCLRPVILVSPQLEKNFSQNEIRDILLHELAHIQRADILWNWLAFIAQTLHWFNPLAWMAARRFRADRELACDSRVLKYLSSDEHSHYGNTLIKIVRRKRIVLRKSVPSLLILEK